MLQQKELIVLLLGGIKIILENIKIIVFINQILEFVENFTKIYKKMVEKYLEICYIIYVLEKAGYNV